MSPDQNRSGRNIRPFTWHRYGLELLAVALGLGLVSLVMSTYWVIDLFVFCLFVLAFDLLYGYMGHLSFGMLLYYGTGAYGTALWLTHVDQNVLAAIGIGLAATVLCAAVLGVVAIQTTGAAFALINMAFNTIGFFVVRSALENLTHGDDGISFTAKPLFGFIRFSHEGTAFIVMLVMVLAVYALLRALMSSPYGVLVRSIREDEVRVKFLGYSTDFYKWLTFVLSSALAGLAGCMFAVIQGFVSPDVISPFHNVDVIFAALIGGAGCLYGALIGAVVFLLIKNFLPIWAAEADKVLPFKVPQWEMWLGVVLLIIVFAWRQGLVGVVRHRLAGRLGPRGRPREEEA